jgi:hypothetical protein
MGRSVMRTLFSATVFLLSFFLLGDSRAPVVAPSAQASLVSVVIARPMAELCSPSPTALVVVLLPGGKTVLPVDAALRHSLERPVEPIEMEEGGEPRWWSLERTVFSRFSEPASELLGEWKSARSSRPETLSGGAPTKEGVPGLEGPL